MQLKIKFCIVLLTVLLLSGCAGQINAAKVVSDPNANVNIKDSSGNTALMYAIKDEEIAVVRKLIARGADVNAKNAEQETALMIASILGHRDVVKLLLEKGADVKAQTYGWGTTAFMYAVYEGHFEVAKLLLKHGANIDHQQTKNGFTELMWSAKLDKADTVKFLIDNGAKLNVKNYAGQTALALAESKGNKAVAAILKSAGAK